MLKQVDHLVLATPNLAEGIDEIERLLGVRAMAGGQHLRWGTRNALVSLGGRVYLEIIGPDPDQPGFAGDRVFGVDQLDRSKLVTWAAKGTNLEEVVERAKQRGQDLGDVQEGARERADGELISWRLTDPYRTGNDGIRPFLIDWGSTAHPAPTLPTGCVLLGLRAEHPYPRKVRADLAELGLEIEIDQARQPALVATVGTPKGKVELR